MFDTGSTGFMLIATSLVMLMTPGLAFFYGGLVGRKNVLAIMICLLYISDADDERFSVEFGGARIIKKTKLNIIHVISNQTTYMNNSLIHIISTQT